MIQEKRSLTSFFKYLAITSAIFIGVMFLLLVINYIQLKRISPLENNRIEKLIVRLNQNPYDENLKQEIRALDLMARKAFFTTTWQLKTGGYLLLAAFIVVLISLKMYARYAPEPVEMNKESSQELWVVRSNQRKWLISASIVSGVTIIVLFVLSYQTYYGLVLTPGIQLLPEKMATTLNDEKDSIRINSIKNDSLNIVQELGNTVSPAVLGQTPGNKTDSVISGQKTEAQIKVQFPTSKQILKNWPSFRGPYGLGISTNMQIPVRWDGTSGKNVLWKISLEFSGLNSPVVWGKYVFFSGGNKQTRKVYCYNLNTGKLVWAKTVENIPGSPAIAPKVTDDTGYAAPSLTVDGNFVFAIFATGDLICFDMEGNTLWAKNMGVPNNHYGHSSSLMVYQNLLLVQYDNNKTRNLYGLSSQTGEIVWNTARPGKISWSSPILIMDSFSPQIVLNNDPYVASYDITTGKEQWKVDALTGEIGSSPAYYKGIVYSTNAYAKLVAIKNDGNSTILWENYDYLPDVSSPVAWGDFLYIATSSGELVCFSAKDGSVAWIHEFDFGFYASPVIAEEKVYALDREGTMHIVKTGKVYKLIAESKIGEKTDCTPAFANGKILIKSKGNLYCIGK